MIDLLLVGLFWNYNLLTNCHKLNICFSVFVFQAIQHLHDNDLIHMDVKPENILLSMDGVCKLGDFGLVVNLKEVSVCKKNLQIWKFYFSFRMIRICLTPPRGTQSTWRPKYWEESSLKKQTFSAWELRCLNWPVILTCRPTALCGTNWDMVLFHPPSPDVSDNDSFLELTNQSRFV